MAPDERDLLTRILRACYEAAPEPLYPARFAAEAGLDRNRLDRALDELRLRGLVRLTEWVQGQGQGYTLTHAGVGALDGVRPGAVPVPPPSVHDEPEFEPEERRRPPLFLQRRPIVCWSLIALNVIVFIYGEFLADRDQMAGLVFFSRYALIGDAVLQRHEWYRLITYAFLHGGILHIACNMYFLYSLGPLLEAMWGSARLLLLYLVAAVTGGCVVVWVNRVGPAGQSIPTVGASGALCGLLGSVGVWVLLNRDYMPPDLASRLSRMVTTNLVLLFLISFLVPNVSWEGHLGGVVGGALASFPLQLSRYGDTWHRRAVGLLGTVLVAAVFVVLAVNQHWRPAL
jgi:membrane associated rhomboid family serine protease